MTIERPTETDTLSVIRWHQRPEVAPPVQVDPIAQDLGIRIYRKHLNDSISGSIERSPLKGGSSGFAITVNASHSHTRRRFTIAHELAHYVLHRDMIAETAIVDDKLYRSVLSNTHERQANQLAAEILMPAHLIRSMYDRLHERDPSSLAKKFDVSRRAMEIRFRELKLNQYVLF